MSLFKRAPKGTAAPTVTPVETTTLVDHPLAAPVSDERWPGGDERWPIVPLLQPAAWCQQAREAIPDPGWWPVVEALPNDLVVTFALDHPDRFETLTEGRADRLGLARDQLTEEAYGILDQRTTGVVLEGGGGRYRVELPDHPDLTASLILNVGRWLHPDQISGRPVLAVARRIMLHVCGADDAESIAGLDDLNRSLFDTPTVEGKRLTPELFTVDPAGHLIALSHAAVGV
jgi:hypothetical protein